MIHITKHRAAVALAVLLILLGASLRVLRHYGWIELPPNVAPVSALAMFAAVYLPRRFALAVPLALMVLSDALIGWYNAGVVVSVYACFAFSLWLGWWLRSRLKFQNLLGATLLGSAVFYFVTNAAVWIFEAAYPNTLAGLGESLLAGLPFFRNTLIGDLAYTGASFGLYHLGMLYLRRFMQPHAALTHG